MMSDQRYNQNSPKDCIDYDWTDDEKDYWSDSDDEWCRELEMPSPKRCCDYLSDSDDEWCRQLEMPSPKRFCEDDEEEQQGGGPLFRFDLRFGTMPRRWKNVVNKTRRTTRLEQLREASDGDQFGSEMTDALRRALLEASREETGLGPNDRLHFTMQANAFAVGSNNCFQSMQFEVAEVRQSGPRLDSYLQQLARQLNFATTPSKIHYCYGSWQKSFETLKKKGVTFGAGVPTEKDLDKFFPNRGLLVMDDLMTEGNNDKTVLDIFTKSGGVSVYDRIRVKIQHLGTELF